MRALIVPRKGGEPESDWYPFLVERVGAGVIPGLVGAGVVPLRPFPDAPDIEESVAELGRAVGDAAGSTVLVGHHFGCAVALSYLATLGSGREVPGLLCVGGAPPADASARYGARYVRVLLSEIDDEPVWVEHLGAEVAIRHGGREFHGEHEISVLINLAALTMEVAEDDHG